MKSHAYAFVTGALTSLTITLYILIWTTAAGDGGAWDSGLGIAFTVTCATLVAVYTARNYTKEGTSCANND